MSESRIRALARFRIAALKHSPYFRDTEASLEAVENDMRVAYERAKTHGRVLFLERAGEVLAGWLQWRAPNPMFGQTTSEFFFECDLKSPEGIHWVRDLIRSQRGRLATNTTARLHRTYEIFLPELAGVGMAVDSIQLLGETEDGVRLLGEPLSPMPYGLIWRSVRTKEDVYGICELRRRVFQEFPENAWFVSNPEHSRFFRDRLLKELEGPHEWQILLRRGETLGFVGGNIHVDVPAWGTVSGLEMVLDERLRGRGLGKEAYRRTLNGLQEKGCALYMGTTSNPSVIALSAKLNRELVFFHVRFGSQRNERHFFPFL